MHFFHINQKDWEEEDHQMYYNEFFCSEGGPKKCIMVLRNKLIYGPLIVVTK